MKKLSVALILAVRLIVATTTVAQAAAPLLPLETLGAASLGDVGVSTSARTLPEPGESGTHPNDIDPLAPAADGAQSVPPPRPSSFYGTVTLDGVSVPERTVVSAWINGVQYAEVATTVTNGDATFVLDVPGDDPNTPQVEGGREGQVIIFEVAGYAAGQMALWHDGGVSELNLAAIAWDGPDLAVMKDDGTTNALSGETLTYILAVINIGNQEATGVTLADTLPSQSITFVAASDGGSEVGGVVTWPAFDLPAGAIVTRTVTVQAEEPLPAGLGAIANTVTASDDGASGPDPTPNNNTASDVDAVAVVPELIASGEKMTGCLPDDVVLPMAMDFVVESTREVKGI